MIIHIFSASRLHLDPKVALAFYEKVPQSQIFVFCEDGAYDNKIYIEMHRKYPQMSMFFVEPNYKGISDIIKRYDDPIVVFQGTLRYEVLIKMRLRKTACDIRWVCWGAGASVNNNLRSKIGRYVKKVLYRWFSEIVVLMEPDRISLKEIFGVESEVIPLPNSRMYLDTPMPSPKMQDDNSIVVYLGNNYHQMSDYIKALDLLLPHKNHIRIVCMCNYPFEDNSVLHELKDKGERLFGDSFAISRTYYDLNGYFQFMNNLDIYICINENQTGLGAISTCMRLGKKVYIQGKNLSWARDSGFVVHSTKELENIKTEDFLQLDSVEVIEHNKKINKMHREDDSRYLKWDRWLNRRCYDYEV